MPQLWMLHWSSNAGREEGGGGGSGGGGEGRKRRRVGGGESLPQFRLLQSRLRPTQEAAVWVWNRRRGDPLKVPTSREPNTRPHREATHEIKSNFYLWALRLGD